MWKKFKGFHWATKTLIISGSFVLLAFTANQGDKHFEVSKNLDIFTSLYKQINLYYVEDVDPGELMKTGIDAMLESLDPYTNFIPESDVEDFRFMTTGEYGGIGALIRSKDDYVVITEPYEGFPAQKAGLKAADVIKAVDGKSIKGYTTTDLSNVLKGQPGTKVTVTIERPGTVGEMDVELTREAIQIDAVPYYGMVNEHIGYIKLNSFTDKSGKEVKDALFELKKNDNLKGIVLDLRGNPGGLLRESIKIVNYFVDKGKDIVSTRGKISEKNKTYSALNAPIEREMPLAVLINGGSASASEIVSGSLQDLDRAVVVGQRSFGKGLVQQPIPLSYNSQVKVTIAKYYTPSGRCIQALDYSHRNEDGEVEKVPDSLITEFKTANGRSVFDGAGVMPDIEVEQDNLSLLTVTLLNNNIIFDFATSYVLTHESIESPEKFALTEQDWLAFKAFISDKDYHYDTKAEKELKDFQKAAEKEAYFEEINEEFKALQEKLEGTKKQDIEEHKKEIMKMISLEIVNRYYYGKGQIRYSVQTDEEVLKAIDVLGNQDEMNSILGVQ